MRMPAPTATPGARSSARFPFRRLLAGLSASLLLLGGTDAQEAAAPPAATPTAVPPATPPAAANAAPTAPDAVPAAAPAPVPAAGAPMKEQAANQQVIEPQIDRRDVHAPKIPSNDFELGLLVGTYDTQNFGAKALGGVRAGYHITEDVFVEAVFGITQVTDKDFRLILPGGIFPSETETLRYYDLSVGYNLFPGEIFLAKDHAKVSALYVIAGIGTTKFDSTSHETVNAGFGWRIFLADWTALQLDLRDHVYSVNLLGQPQTTQNLELSMGVTFFF
jgi:outer membrane beta-barrel protein